MTMPPGFVLILAGVILPVLPLRARQAVMLLAPLLTLVLVWMVPDGPGWTVPFLGYDLVLTNGDSLSRLFGIVFSIMAFGGALYALNQTNVAELVAAFCYAGSARRRRLRWRSDHRLRLLGDDGDRLDHRGLGRRRRCACRGPALRRRPSSWRRAADGGHRRAYRRNRLDRLHRHAHRQPGALADHRRLPGQCRRPAALGLAARRLSGKLLQRHRVPLRLHHQGGGLCAAARVSRRRDPHLRRPVDGLLRHHLRHPRKRHPPHPVLFAGQPGRLHGDRHRHRHADGAQRRRRACLHPHHLQGAAADVGRFRHRR